MPLLKALILFSIISVSSLTAQTEDSPIPENGTTPEFDQELRVVLIETGLPVQFLEGGTFAFALALKNQRSHQVYINSEVADINGYKVREIWAPAAFSTKGFSEMTMRNILNDAGQDKLTAWKFKNIAGQETLVAFAKIPASTSAKDLITLCALVMEAADEWELEITGKDDL